MLILFVTVLSAVLTVSGNDVPGAQNKIKKQLAAEYSQIESGFRRNNPSPWIERLSPDFELTLFNGQKQNREWVVNYVRNNAKTIFKIPMLAQGFKGRAK